MGVRRQTLISVRISKEKQKAKKSIEKQKAKNQSKNKRQKYGATTQHTLKKIVYEFPSIGNGGTRTDADQSKNKRQKINRKTKRKKINRKTKGKNRPRCIG